jgi:hypothetical protein
VNYLAVCALLGLAAGWIPMFLHGPIAEKFNALNIDGRIAVWAWYTARCSIGFWIGLASAPRAWWLRGPLVGLLVVLPLTLVSLAMPQCGFPCMRANLASAAAVGLLVAGLARLITGRSHA